MDVVQWIANIEASQDTGGILRQLREHDVQQSGVQMDGRQFRSSVWGIHVGHEVRRASMQVDVTTVDTRRVTGIVQKIQIRVFQAPARIVVLRVRTRRGDVSIGVQGDVDVVPTEGMGHILE